MHRRVIARVSLGDRVDHRLRLLRGRGAVEIVPVPNRRELVAHVERGIDARRGVHTTLLNALFAASQDELARMADEALRDLDEGRTDELDPDNL